MLGFLAAGGSDRGEAFSGSVRAGSLPALCLFLGSFSAFAQTTDPVGDSTSALPGLARVAVAGPIRSDAAFAASAGYGFTEAVLDESDSHHRASGSLAASVRVVDALALALRFDGRYDSHAGLDGGSGTDDGWVGDPRLIVRGSTTRSRGLQVGGQLALWMPGADAPSFDAGATTVDFLLLGSYSAPRVVVAANAGFRLDRSGATIEEPDSLSRADRLALGVSDSNALLTGVGVGWHPAPNVELIAEATWDVLLGNAAPSALESPLRFDLGARWSPTTSVEVSGVAEIGASRRPAVAEGDPLSPVEPRFSMLVALGFRLGAGEARTAPRHVAAPVPTRRSVVPDGAAAIVEPCSLRGRVTGAGGEPIAGAHLRVVSAAGLSEGTTGADGTFEVRDLQAGQVTVTFSAEGHGDALRTLDVGPGQTIVVDQPLQRSLPEGQIRGVVSSLRGAPLRATITVQPLGLEVTSDREGAFQVDVPPGAYTVVVLAPGYRTQQRRLRVEDNGVTVLNADLVEERR
ncbi:MAG: carboxypeptidase regulatory-like domain-containing protein [Deltaproteobacteria bacterium]|nr:carboxypeptidase regulatory-like domain-containing protein [Deltaproteobacteria bacterium]